MSKRYYKSSEPGLCMVCPIPEREHAQRWTAGAGWHGWIPPTQAVIWSRMVVRRQEEPGAGRWIRWEDQNRMGYRKW